MDQLLLKQQMAQKLTPAPVGMKKVREDISVFKKIALGEPFMKKKVLKIYLYARPIDQLLKQYIAQKLTSNIIASVGL